MITPINQMTMTTQTTVVPAYGLRGHLMENAQ